jgi:hypothetical protein
VETEIRNQQGENVKPEIVDGYNKFMRGMNRGHTKYCTITHAADSP